MKLSKENVFTTKVGDKYALVDRDGGMIYIITEDNMKLYENGEEFEVLASETNQIQSANSNGGGWGAGGKPKRNSIDGFGSFDGFDDFEELN